MYKATILPCGMSSARPSVGVEEQLVVCQVRVLQSALKNSIPDASLLVDGRTDLSLQSCSRLVVREMVRFA